MRSRMWFGFLALVLVVQALPASAACDCGPDYCLDDPRYPTKLATKKASLTKAGYPNDLVDLMDRGGACVARVEQSPDGFSLKTVKTDGSLLIAWSKEDEDIARQQLLKGTIDAYYKFNTAKVFKCCGQTEPEARPDWDAKLGMNKSQAIACTKAGGTVKCK